MSVLKTKEDKDQFLFWIATLEAGVFDQGTHRLQRGNKYCCLGVAVACTVPEYELFFDFLLGKDVLAGGLLDSQPVPLWLLRVNADFKVKTGKYLHVLNDSHVSHPEIASMLLTVYADELNAIEN